VGIAFATWDNWSGRSSDCNGTVSTGGIYWFEDSCEGIKGIKQMQTNTPRHIVAGVVMGIVLYMCVRLNLPKVKTYKNIYTDTD